MEYVTLSNGVKMPILGYGVYQVTKDECERCVLDALKVGYRAIDTAQSYFNEEEVGNAIEKSGVPREEIFLTTKVWIEHYGYEEAKKSVLESMKKLKTDYLDLVLLHQPFSDAYGAYRALEDLYDEGKIRAIGISNFYVDRMVDFASFNRIKPMINQVETHIFNQQKELKEWADKYGIQLEAWAPLEKEEEVLSIIQSLMRLLRNMEKLQHRLCFAGIFKEVLWLFQNQLILKEWKRISMYLTSHFLMKI